MPHGNVREYLAKQHLYSSNVETFEQVVNESVFIIKQSLTSLASDLSGNREEILQGKSMDEFEERTDRKFAWFE